jgi:hypothetical protein
MTDMHEPNEARLRELLRQARPSPLLPPRFQESVWRRIERGEYAPGPVAPLAWLDALAGRLFRPRLALAGVAALLVLGGVLGVAQGTVEARHAARAAYLSAVAPNTIR